MTTYHVTPDGPRTCDDKTGRCPYKKLEKPHFESHSEAMNYYESAMEEQFGHSGLSKTNAVRQKAYAKRDQVTDAASAKIADVKSKASKAAEKGRREVNMWKGDARVIKGYAAHVASTKLKVHKERVTASTTKVANTATRVARNAQDRSTAQMAKASAAAQTHTEKATQRTKAAARVTRKVAILAGRDTVRGLQKVDSRYQIRSRIKSAVSKVSTPVSRYAKSRAQIIRRIAKSEFASGANQTVKSTHCSPATQSTQSQAVLKKHRKDFFIGA